MNIKITFSLALFIVSVTSFAQGTLFGQPIANRPVHGVVRCASTEYERYLQQSFADRATDVEFEAWLAPKVEAVKARLSAQKNAKTTQSINAIITIPVAVHVIHNGTPIGNNSPNLSVNRILSQIQVLNEDFRRMLNTPGYNDIDVGADVEVEFCMAQVDPDGAATNGIDRWDLGQEEWSMEDFDDEVKPNTQWDPENYFNIWVCDIADDPLFGPVLGYAQFPSNSGLGGLDTNGGFADTDGLVIHWRTFGTSDEVGGTFDDFYDKGRTATHEMGHCFGLRHIWGDNDSCVANSTDSQKDYCPDTPAASDYNGDCFFEYDSCPNSPGDDMTNNYMDYTNDECMNIFTLDQKARILAVLENSPRRNTLGDSNVCQSLGVPSHGSLQGVNLYPNPASDFVTLGFNDTVGLPDAFVIYNTLGQAVLSKEVSATADLKINTSAFSNGVYFIKVSKNNAEKTLRFVKN